MADTIAIELIDNTTLKDQHLYWKIYPLFEKMFDEKKHAGKKLYIYHIDIEIDTSTANTPTDSTIPSNAVKNFAAPQQVYIRSSAAADQGLEIDVIGQKADGTFGQFTLTSHATNGTTPVDVGTWNFIMYPINKEAWAGNLIIDDDGISGTVFWTLALGVSGVDGIVVIPDGYNGSILYGRASLRDVPAANANGILLSFGDKWIDILNDSQPTSTMDKSGYVAPAQAQVPMSHAFKSAVTVSTVHLNILLWEV